jgi:hypothetical protein
MVNLQHLHCWPFLLIHILSLSLPWPIKGGLNSPFHHTPALKQSSPHSHPQWSKETPSHLPANFVQPHSPQFTASFLMIQPSKCSQFSLVDAHICPQHHIQKSDQKESGCSKDIIHHGCCQLSVRILKAFVKFGHNTTRNLIGV